MNPVNLTVEEVTQEAGKLVSTTSPRGVNLGDAPTEKRVNALIGEHRQLGGRVFLLTWEGDKVPRGAEVAGHVIAWTQNGMVVQEDGLTLGTYDRLEEFGGRKRNQHKMLVYLYPSVSKIEAAKR